MDVLTDCSLRLAGRQKWKSASIRDTQAMHAKDATYEVSISRRIERATIQGVNTYL